MPAVRMTRRGRYTSERAMAYVQYVNDLADWLRNSALEYKLECPISVPVRIDIISCYTDGLKRDGDNIYKAVVDAMVKSGILLDDSLRLVPQFSLTGRLYQTTDSLTIQVKKARYR